ncbi:ceramide-1-phosphate transfer protein-like [Platichthys flesus]|uniref:ceramide-1-phosphate transfer protein-like n=1 Tax=Platichthys flesus TaxID=8260 RepID=UPI002DC03B4B|nr:ceramide-1-phosphate transfer protein-like [Platichthys flesus]XP_062239570.1 ceramide-1-phosphate transfer protein-like [Platichthys flesus]
MCVFVRPVPEGAREGSTFNPSRRRRATVSEGEFVLTVCLFSFLCAQWKREYFRVAMVILRRTPLLRYLLLAAMLALFLFVSSLWLPQGGVRDCGSSWQPCIRSYQQTPEPPLAPGDFLQEDEPTLLTKECPGQKFQVRELLLHLRSSLSDEEDDDVLLEPYLQSWDQLLNFMESLGTMVSLFSMKVNEKVVQIRALSLKHSADVYQGQTPPSFGLKTGAYRSVRSMVEAELKAGVVDFSRHTDSGCRTLLRLHRSLLWLKLMLEGLSEGPDADGQYKTPGELSRDAYQVALAPHHPWVLRQAAEFAFLALPDRQYFLQLVCVQNQSEATPVLRVIIHALMLVHTRTQRILEEHNMLELP